MRSNHFFCPQTGYQGQIFAFKQEKISYVKKKDTLPSELDFCIFFSAERSHIPSWISQVPPKSEKLEAMHMARNCTEIPAALVRLRHCRDVEQVGRTRPTFHSSSVWLLQTFTILICKLGLAGGTWPSPVPLDLVDYTAQGADTLI